MQCDAPQQYKINFSKYHGVCINHVIEPFAMQACQKCGSEVSILMLSDINCTFCGSRSSTSDSACSHNICESCFNKSLKCEPCGRAETQCEYCLKLRRNYSQRECSHFICHDCASKESETCPVCDHERLSLREIDGKEYGSCSYCLFEAWVKKVKSCEEHLLCDNCLQGKSDCVMCKLRSEDERSMKDKPDVVIVDESEPSSKSDNDEEDKAIHGPKKSDEEGKIEINKFAIPPRGEESKNNTVAIDLIEVPPVEEGSALENIEPAVQRNWERRQIGTKNANSPLRNQKISSNKSGEGLGEKKSELNVPIEAPASPNKNKSTTSLDTVNSMPSDQLNNHVIPVDSKKNENDDEDDASSTSQLTEDRDNSSSNGWSVSGFFSYLCCCVCCRKKQTKKKFK